MIMKMHSYLTVNGHMQVTRARAESALSQLKQLVAKSYPESTFDDEITEAQSARLEKEKREELAAMLMLHSDSSGTSTPKEGTPLPPDGDNPNAISSYVDIATATALRRRLNGASDANGLTAHSSDSLSGNTPVPVPANGGVATSAGTPSQAPAGDFIAPSAPPPPRHPLIHHPNPDVVALAEEYSEILADLRSSGPRDYTQWPNNISWKNFADFMLIPTLVYELEYPRTTRIRPVYIFEKTVRICWWIVG
jgi:sterol O-acyltransferase